MVQDEEEKEGKDTHLAGAQFNWILKTLLNILLRFLLSFTGCPTVLQNSIEKSIEYT